MYGATNRTINLRLSELFNFQQDNDLVKAQTNIKSKNIKQKLKLLIIVVLQPV